MALPKSCWYFRNLAPGALGTALDAFARDVIDRVLSGHIDGANVHDSFIGPDSGLAWDRRSNAPKRLYIPLLSPTGPGTIRRKGSSPTNPKGVEILVDPTDTTYGRVCVVDSDTPSVQRISLIPEDPASVTNPGGTFSTPTGTWIAEGRAGDEFVFNESSIDTDFRVESNGNANAINVDAGNDRVGILKVPGVAFDVAGKIRTDNQVESTIAPGTAPLVVASDTMVTNLNADKVDGRGFSGWNDDSIPGLFDGEAFNSVFKCVNGDTFGSINGDFRPFSATNTNDLGSASLAFKELYVRNIDTDGAQTLTIQRNNVTHMSFDGEIEAVVNLHHTAGGRKVPTTRTVMSGTVTLVATSNEWQFCDPDGSSRNIDLPTAATGMAFGIKNFGNGGETLTVRDAAAATVATLSNDEWGYFVYDGTSWQGMGLF